MYYRPSLALCQGLIYGFLGISENRHTCPNPDQISILLPSTHVGRAEARTHMRRISFDLEYSEVRLRVSPLPAVNGYAEGAGLWKYCPQIR